MGLQYLGILTFPIERSGITPLTNLIRILSNLSADRIALITGNSGISAFKGDPRVQLQGICHKRGENAVSRLWNYIIAQLRLAYLIARQQKTDLWVFFFGGELLVLPMVTAKIQKKPVILVLPASNSIILASSCDAFQRYSRGLTEINCRLCDRIVLYSPSLIREWGLERFRDKIRFAPEHLIDYSAFRERKPLGERSTRIAYVGRHVEEKGILQFVQAIPEILSARGDIECIIAGDGPLRERLEQSLREANVSDRVRFTGWIPHDELPEFFNTCRLVVLPSFTEGLPNVMLEAMACGTPVLATPVGAVPDFIRDGESGFIAPDNTPACLTYHVLRALAHPDLEAIAREARDHVQSEMNPAVAVERFARIVEGLKNRR
ncbi:MAG: glycosyltransferase family 4 protein [Methanomicrobiales archaeon]|nr:glycosyltransferase family 4 protein [Methanomicrobiales archaeon]MDI6877544.1 glycosyltransferase family 4 protein [Methanomicrobiales archaeon]